VRKYIEESWHGIGRIMKTVSKVGAEFMFLFWYRPLRGTELVVKIWIDLIFHDIVRLREVL
jgi:hypothetical protein